jgi:hypothetical protein
MTWTDADREDHGRVCRFDWMPDDAGLHEYDTTPDDDAVAVAVSCEWYELRKETP